MRPRGGWREMWRSLGDGLDCCRVWWSRVEVVTGGVSSASTGMTQVSLSDSTSTPGAARTALRVCVLCFVAGHLSI